MTRIKDCICRQYKQIDPSTMTDKLFAAMGNIETALLHAGADPRSYTHLDLAKLGMQFLCSQSTLDLTLEDIEPAHADSDALSAPLTKALEGINETGLSEAIAAMGLHQPSRAMFIRIGKCMTDMGWLKFKGTDGKILYRRGGA